MTGTFILLSHYIAKEDFLYQNFFFFSSLQNNDKINNLQVIPKPTSYQLPNTSFITS